MSRALAAPRCNHYHADGRRCGSPALKGKRFCHFHRRLFKPARRHYDLPDIEDAASLHCAILQVVRGAAEDGLTAGQARLMLYALQIAAGNLRHLSARFAAGEDTEAPQ